MTFNDLEKCFEESRLNESEKDYVGYETKEGFFEPDYEELIDQMDDME